MPTFFAPDLTTEFYRLGLKVKREEITRELRNRLLAEHADRTDPTPEEVQSALDGTPANEIMEAGEEAALNTIMRGRQNTPMPAWQNRIRPEQIEAVMRFLRSRQQTPG